MLCISSCDWKCPHYSCTCICSQECNRPPCNHPCRKPLNCGHVCSGLCGEPCISLCRRCKKDKFYRVAWPPSDKGESSRFLELQPCRHIVEVAAMDRCFLDMLTSLPYTLDQRRFLVCPVCSDKVSFCPRYNQYIRRHESQINEALQLIEGSRRLKKIATEYIAEWSISHHLEPENRQRLFMRSLRQRLRLGALCILQEIETMALQTNKSDFHKTFLLSLGSVIERVKQNNFYLDDDKTTTTSGTILMYNFYMEAQTYRLASFIRGPKLRVLDKCKEHLQAFESMDLVEENFPRIWEKIEKLNRKLSKKLSIQDRRDDVEDYIDHLNRFFDLELDATLTSRWMCCTYGHVYAKNELPNGNRINALCPDCHPLHHFLLGFLKPDRSSERNPISKIDTTFYRQNISNHSASGRQNRTREESRRTDHGNEGASEKSGSATRKKTAESETLIDFNNDGRPTIEFVRGRGRSQGRRRRGRSIRGGSQVDRNSEYLPGRNQQSLAQTEREPQASVQSPPDLTLRMPSDSPRGGGRGRGGWSMGGRFGIEQTDQTSTFGELQNSMRDAASITYAPRGNFRANKRGFNDRWDPRDMQMSTEHHNTQTHRPTYNRCRESPSFWSDTVRTQLENIQAVSNPTLPEKPKNDQEDVVRSQDAETNGSPCGNVEYGPMQNSSRAKYKRGSRGRRPFRK